MTCSSCMHYLARGYGSARISPKAEPRNDADFGICRRSPPTVFLNAETDDFESAFPTIHRDHQCGSWECELPL